LLARDQPRASGINYYKITARSNILRRLNCRVIKADYLETFGTGRRSVEPRRFREKHTVSRFPFRASSRLLLSVSRLKSREDVRELRGRRKRTAVTVFLLFEIVPARPAAALIDVYLSVLPRRTLITRFPSASLRSRAHRECARRVPPRFHGARRGSTRYKNDQPRASAGRFTALIRLRLFSTRIPRERAPFRCPFVARAEASRIGVRCVI